MNYKSEAVSSEQLGVAQLNSRKWACKSFLGENDLKDEQYERERTNILPSEEKVWRCLIVR